MSQEPRTATATATTFPFLKIVAWPAGLEISPEARAVHHVLYGENMVTFWLLVGKSKLLVHCLQLAIGHTEMFATSYKYPFGKSNLRAFSLFNNLMIPLDSL